MARKKSSYSDDMLTLPFDFDEITPVVTAEPAFGSTDSTAGAETEVNYHAILRKDFLGRDSSFVHQRKTGRLGWETLLPEGESFSSYVIDVTDEEAVLRNAYRIARETLAAMDLPKKVNIRINNSETNCTDFENVYVCTNMFDNDALTTGQKADIFTGLAIHEGCHLMYTDRACVPKGDRLLHSIHNVVEDERIERILGEELPGYANFLKMVKYYYFDLYEKQQAEKGLSDEPYVRLFNAILHVIRYPAALSERDIDDFGKELMAVRDILSDWPSTTQEALERSERIYDLFKKALEERGAGDGSSSDDGEPSEGGSEGTPSSGTGKGSRGKGKPSEGKGDDKEGTESESGKDSSGKPGKKSSGKETEKKSGDGGTPLSPADIKAILDKLAEMTDTLSRDAGEELGDEEMSDTVKESPRIQELCDGSAEHGKESGTIFLKPDANGDGVEGATADPKAVYMDSLARVKRYIPAVKKILTSNATDLRYTERGALSGKLDTDKLAEAVQGCRGVYVRHGEVKSNRIAVCILLDESGSMACGYDGRSRIAWARDAAVLLNEGLKDIPNVDLFIYGHTADQDGPGTTQVFTYRDRSNRSKYALGSARARYENADGFAIREVAERVRRQTAEQCLFFVLSDGAPAAYVYYRGGRNGIEDTRKAVEEVTRKGFIPVQIAISSDVNPDRMFKDWVTLTDLASLPGKLGKVIRKAVLKHSGRSAKAA